MREAEWLNRPEWADVAVRTPAELASGCRRVVVLSAHPDDETIAVGALVASLARTGLPVVAVVATAGENSHPAAGAWRPPQLAEVRRAEIRTALGVLAPDCRLIQLDHVDSGLAATQDRLVQDLLDVLRPDDLLLAPWSHDGHPDHEAAGRAARAAAERTGCVRYEYPVWLWSWSGPEAVPWDRAVVVGGDTFAAHAKQRALACFPSQTLPLGPGAGDAPVVGPDLLTRAGRLVECLFAADAVRPGSARRPDPTVFDAMYAGGATDPWGFEDSFYEARKRALVLAVLGRDRYGRVLEIGCATGRFTADLAPRAGHVVAMDLSRGALEVARARGLAAVDWCRGAVPADTPDGPFDLIVLSEVGYFLTPVDLLATFRRMRGALAEGGELVLVDWRHPTRDVPLDGPLVHAQAAAAFGDLPHRAHYEDADVVVDVWGQPVSVAGRGRPSSQRR